MSSPSFLHLLATVLLSVLLVPRCGSLQIPDTLKGYSLLDARPESDQDLELLRFLDSEAPEDAIDFWTEPYTTKEQVTMLVHPEVLQSVEDAFQQSNLSYNIRLRDFQDRVIEEQREIDDLKGDLEFRDPSNRLAFDLFTYHPLEEIHQYLDAIAKEPRDLVVNFERSTIGTTFEGRPIHMVKVTSKDTSKKRPAIWMDCGIHAREWVSQAFCLYAIDRLLDPEGSDVIAMFDVFIVPVANPDGYVYSWTTNRMWRKNRRVPQGFFRRLFRRQTPSVYKGLEGLSSKLSNFKPPSGTKTKCVGADPNRNFDVKFGESGSSGNSCQDTFHGVDAFSEAESKAIRDALHDIIAQYGKERFAAFVSVHAYSQLWMSPHGHIKERSGDYKSHQIVAEAAVKAIQALYGTEYKYGPINEVIYQASGSSVDYAHSVLGIKYSYALELRDKGESGFILPVQQVQPTLEETWQGIRAMASQIAKEYPAM